MTLSFPYMTSPPPDASTRCITEIFADCSTTFEKLALPVRAPCNESEREPKRGRENTTHDGSRRRKFEAAGSLVLQNAAQLDDRRPQRRLARFDLHFVRRAYRQHVGVAAHQLQQRLPLHVRALYH